MNPRDIAGERKKKNQKKKNKHQKQTNKQTNKQNKKNQQNIGIPVATLPGTLAIKATEANQIYR